MKIVKFTKISLSVKNVSQVIILVSNIIVYNILLRGFQIVLIIGQPPVVNLVNSLTMYKEIFANL